MREVARGWRWGARPLVPESAQEHRPPLEPAGEFATAWARTPVAVGVRAGVQAGGLKPLVWSQVAPQVRGHDNLVDLKGPVIFTANHSSHLDAPLILCSLPPAWRRRTLVTAAADYFFDAWWRATGTALAFGTVPLDRRGTTATSSSTPRELLDAGWNLLIFPEGTRSPDGQLGPFKSGTARLAMSAGVPIVPIGLRGAYSAMPRGRGWPVPGRKPRQRPLRNPAQAATRRERQAAHRPHAPFRQPTLRRRLQHLVGVDQQEAPGAGHVVYPAPSNGSAPNGEMAHWRRVWASSEPVRHEAPRVNDPWSSAD